VISIGLHGSGPKAAAPKKKGTKHGSAATVPCLILGALSTVKQLNRSDIGEAVRAGGRAATSVPDALTKLKKLKQVVPVGDGSYKITPAGVKRYQTACKIGTE
jgi:hypothetical protein